MKFNLKNRPKCDDYAGDYVIFYKDGRKFKGYCHEDMERWFEGFEKELRVKIEKYREELNMAGVLSRIGLLAKINLIKEILGEDVSD